MTKAELIDKHRHWNLHDDWWASTYDDFKADMGDIGIRVHRMYFSGFASQGDGACFEGEVDNWELFLQSLGCDQPVLAQHAENSWNFSVRHQGPYCHAYSTRFEHILSMPDGYTDDEFIRHFSPYPHPETDFRSQAWLAVLSQFAGRDFEQEFTDAFRGHMQQLYKRLEDEHDYLTSDVVVWASLEANDMTEEELK
jgi:hypothetical protein